MKTHFNLSLGKMARSCLLFCALVLSASAFSVQYYWVGGSGDWNDPAHWDFSSGGAGGDGVPGFADNVTFNSSSGISTGTVTINCHATCHDMTWSSGVGGATFTGSSVFSLTITGSLTFDTDINFDFPGAVRFEAVSSSETITSASQQFKGHVYFDGPGADWAIQDNYWGAINGKVTYLQNGTLDLNGNIMRIFRFVSNNSNTRELDLSGVSTLHIIGSYANNHTYCWDTRTTTNFTLTVDNSMSLIFEPNIGSGVVYMASDNLTFDGEVTVATPAKNAIFEGENTYAYLGLGASTQFNDDNTVGTLEMLPGAIYSIAPGKTVEITDIWDAGGTCNSWITFKSTHSGQTGDFDFTGTLSAVNLNLDYFVIEDVGSPTANWVANPSYIPNIANMTSNGDWPTTTVTGQTYTWDGGGDGTSWSDPDNWDIGTCAPNPLDDVTFDGASFGPGETLNIDIGNAVCNDMDWTGATNTPTFDGADDAGLTLYGSLTALTDANMDWDYEGSIYFKSHSGTETVNTEDNSLDGPVYFEGESGTWDLAHDFTSSKSVYVTAGSFVTQHLGTAYDMEIWSFYSNIKNTRTVDITNSTVTCTWHWDIYSYEEVGGGADATLTLNPNGSTIELINGNFQGHNDYGNTYNDLEMQRTNGTQRLYAANTFGGDVTFLGNGIIHAANTINGDITFSAGKAYNITGTQVLNQTGSDLNADGDCTNGYIYIKGGGFSKASGGNQTVEYCIIKNNAAATSGSVTFHGDNSILFGSSNGIWTVTNPYSGPLYFQASASDKDWNTGNNWYSDPAFTTYPSAGACPPNPLNDVYFIDYSFDLYTSGTKGAEVDVSNAFCKSMYWGDPGGTYDPPYDYGVFEEHNSNDALHVFGNMLLQDNTIMDWDFNGDVMFEGDDASTTYTVETAGQLFQQETTIDGNSTSTWELQDALTTNTGTVGISVDVGEFNTGGQNVTTGHIWSDGSSTRAIDISNSTVTLKTRSIGNTYWAWESNNTNFTLSASGSTVSLDNVILGEPAWLDADNVTFNDVTFEAECEGYILGDDNKTFHDITFNGNGFMNCDNEITGDLYMRPGYVYILEEGTRQTLTPTADLQASGTLGNTVFIKSSSTGDEAEIEKDGGTICLNYTSIRDNDAVLTNGAMLFDGPNGFNVANNTNWAFTSCTPETVYGCAGEGVTFTSLFNGTSFDWDFGDGSGTSTATQPTYTYAAAGTYTVSVTVTSNTTTDVQYFYAEISPSCCQAAQDPEYEDISGNLTASAVWPDKVFVSADVFVLGTDRLEITNSDVVFADGAGIFLEEDASLVAVNSTFRPCDPSDDWAGIDFADDSYGSINECAIIGATVGTNVDTDVEVECSNNQYLNCETGIYYAVATNASMEHVATGNTFVINADNVFTTGGTDNFYGIQINTLRLDGVVSQNDFVYSSSATVNDQFYGIYNSGGEVFASENNFTNVTFCYTQIGGLGNNAFENNEIDFNKAAISLYSTPSDIAAVTIDGASNPTLVGNNRMTLTYASGENSWGVYSNGSSGLVVRNNEINGFEEGVRLAESETVEISFNEINDSELGIYAETTNSLIIEDNAINMSTVDGIYLSDCVNEVEVDRNTVKNDPNTSSTVGIRYIIDGTTAVTAVEFVDNCVFDTRDAMYFENTHASNCQAVPLIQGNYLFNYSNDGIYIDQLTGTIGTGGTPGRNSFLTNAGGGFDINVVFSTCGSPCITSQNNWPNGLNVNGDINDLGGSNHSYSTCGNQTVKDGENLPALEAFIVDRYPVSYDAKSNTFSLQPDFEYAFNGLSADQRANLAVATHGVLASNKEPNEAETFISGLDTRDLVDREDLDWIRFRHAMMSSDWTGAETQLASLSARDQDEEDRNVVEGIRIKLIQQDSGMQVLSEQDRETLERIDLRRGAFAAQARDVIHVTIDDHPYIYNKDRASHSREYVKGQNRVAEQGAMLLYPNPAMENVSVSFTVEELSGGQLTVHNMFGELMREYSLTGNMKKIQLDVSDMPAGIYLISVYNNDELLDAQQLIKN